MKILVTGAGGLVGRAVVAHAHNEGCETVALDHRTLDISDSRLVTVTLNREQPDVVINCAAWTDVDGCETDQERAIRANADGPESLAHACREINAALITISTDYIFDGEKQGFYTQDDEPKPISRYGASKLAGERRAQGAWKRTMVARSGYIFGAGGTNFLSTIVPRVIQGQDVRAITDMVGTPTYAVDLARQLVKLAAVDVPGVYHLVNAGAGASFAEFAAYALELAGLDPHLVRGAKLSDLQLPAPRPRNSRLKCLVSDSRGLSSMPFWKDSVREFVSALSRAKSAGFERDSV